MQKFVKAIEKINYWLIILLPFSVGIAPAIANSIIGVMICAFLLEKSIRREKLFSVSLPVIVFGVFMIIGALSFINSVNIHDSLKGMTKLLKFLMIFLVCRGSIKDKPHFKRIAIAVACAISFIGIDALWQIFTGKDFIHGNSIQGAIGIARATASFPGCNGLGVYLTALTPFIAGLALFCPQPSAKLFFTLAALIGSAGVYLSLSRGAGIGLFIAVFFLGLIKKSKFIISILILLLLIYPFVMPKNIKDWAKNANYNPIILLTDEVRVGIYRNTLHMIARHPFIGVGINTFSRTYGEYRTAEVEAANPTADGYYAHNNFLHMAGEMGLLGLGVFMIFLLVTLRSIWISFRRYTDPFLKACAISVFAAIIAYLINGLTETSLYYSRIVMIFWFLIGLGLALRDGIDGSESKKEY